MSLLLFILVAISTGVASLLIQRNRLLSAAIGGGGLVVAFVLATRISTADVLRFAGSGLAGSDYARLFLVFGSVAGLLSALLAVATTWSVALPGAWLIILAGSAVALSVTDSAAAIAAASLGALAGVAVTVGPVATSAGLEVARRELRAVVAACILGLAAAGVVTGPAAIGLDPPIVGLAYVAVVGAAAIRLGAIPFHIWVARAADTAPPVALSLPMAWAPAAFVAAALAWLNVSIMPVGEAFSSERALIIVVAALTIVLGSVAATVHPDLEHIVGYSIVADGAVALLGFAVLDSAGWGPTRTWLLAFVLAKSAFAAWVAAVHFTYGARQVGELDGWARRSPLLGLGLLAVFVASVGLPGMLNLATRIALARLALPQLLAVGLLALSVVSLGYYLRLGLIGLRRPTAAVAAGADPMPRLVSRRIIGGGAPRGAASQIEDVLANLRANRAPIAAGLVLVMAAVAVMVSAGGFGIEDAAAAARPESALPVALAPADGAASNAP